MKSTSSITGLVNASLLIYTRSVLPNTATLPTFTTPRPRPHSKSSSVFSFVSSSVDHTSEKAASLDGGDDRDSRGFGARVPEIRFVNADESAWKKVRTVPLGGVTPFVLPPLEVSVPSARASPSPSPPPQPSPASSSATNARKSFLKLITPKDRPDSLTSTMTEASSSSKRKPLKKLTIPKPILPRLRPSQPLMIDTDYYFSGSGSKEPMKVLVTRQSVESFESYDEKSMQ